MTEPPASPETPPSPPVGARPRLRYVEAQPIEVEGQEMVAMRDPEGIADTIALPVPLFFVAAHLDGDHDPTAIQLAFLKQFGAMLPRERVDELIDLLEAKGFIDGPGFDARRNEQREAFLALATRPATHGGAYGGTTAEEVGPFLEDQWSREGGPGGPPRRLWPGAAADGDPDGDAARGGRLRAFVAPHIDLHRGGACYGWTFREVAETLPADADTFVVFGTCHAGQETLFALTTKGYETPFGTLDPDDELLREVLARCDGSEDLLADEICHRNEHSIEFQALYIQYILRKRAEAGLPPPARPPRALFVLCGSFHRMILEGSTPSAHPDFQAFVAALHAALAALDRRPVFVAGADLAHVGARFGDDGLPKTRLDEIGEADRTTLEKVVALDLDAFHADIAADRDARRICGHAPIAALLGTLASWRGDEISGRLVHYDQWYDGESSVTYAGLTFFDGEPPGESPDG